MDGLLGLLAVVWAFTALFRSVRKRGGAPPTPGAGTRTLRPSEVDLPGQSPTLPFHPDEAPASSPSPPVVIRPADLPSPRRELTDMVEAWQAPRSEMKSRLTDVADERPESSRIVPPPVTIPGLSLSFDRDALLKGVIFSEILTRPSQRRRR